MHGPWGYIFVGSAIAVLFMAVCWLTGLAPRMRERLHAGFVVLQVAVCGIATMEVFVSERSLGTELLRIGMGIVGLVGCVMWLRSLLR